MALNPIDEAHAAQIQAGTAGRQAGHAFEDTIALEINGLDYPVRFERPPATHVSTGDPALQLLAYISGDLGMTEISKAVALSTGALATSELGRQWLDVNGVHVRRCKSDIVLTIYSDDGAARTVGISTKQCNNRKPTNAQLYFTTARGFAGLLMANGIQISQRAIDALRQFCGDPGFRPLDDAALANGRLTDPLRYFWEEIDRAGRQEWEAIFADRRDDITRLMLQKAYIDDPFVPTYLLHKTRAARAWVDTETAIYRIDELVALSSRYGSFSTRPYSVRKGSHRDPPGVTHLAPRFDIVQMQRGGQAQHPDQLQFNLEAGYFYKLQNIRANMSG
jgi:hypothetical protein